MYLKTQNDAPQRRPEDPENGLDGWLFSQRGPRRTKRYVEGPAAKKVAQPGHSRDSVHKKKNPRRAPGVLGVKRSVGYRVKSNKSNILFTVNFIFLQGVFSYG